MAFKPNYRQKRAEHDRVKRERQAEKLREQQERVAQRKAERENPATDTGDISGQAGKEIK